MKLFCDHIYIEKGSFLFECGMNKMFIFRCTKCGKEKGVTVDKLNKCTLERGYIRK